MAESWMKLFILVPKSEAPTEHSVVPIKLASLVTWTSGVTAKGTVSKHKDTEKRRKGGSMGRDRKREVQGGKKRQETSAL